MKNLLSMIIIFNFISLDICYSSEISDMDLKIIKYADIYSGSNVIKKLENIYKLNGADALKPAIPAISERVISILNKSDNDISLSDGEGEYLGSLLRILSISGDINAKNALLRAMTSKNVGGLVISKGLMKLGHQVLPEIKIHLNDKNKRVVRNTILTLKEIAELDSSGIFLSNEEKNNFKEYLLTQLKDFDDSLKFCIISAIGSLGDASTINILEEIKNNDGYNNSGMYINRMAAGEAIRIIKIRNQLK